MANFNAYPTIKFQPTDTVVLDTSSDEELEISPKRSVPFKRIGFRTKSPSQTNPAKSVPKKSSSEESVSKKKEEKDATTPRKYSWTNIDKEIKEDSKYKMAMDRLNENLLKLSQTSPNKNFIKNLDTSSSPEEGKNKKLNSSFPEVDEDSKYKMATDILDQNLLKLSQSSANEILIKEETTSSPEESKNKKPDLSLSSNDKQSNKSSFQFEMNKTELKSENKKVDNCKKDEQVVELQSSLESSSSSGVESDVRRNNGPNERENGICTVKNGKRKEPPPIIFDDEMEDYLCDLMKTSASASKNQVSICT